MKSMKQPKKNRWLEPMDLCVDRGSGEAWLYVSKSGKTIEVLINAKTERVAEGDKVLRSVKISIPRVQRWVGK